MTLFSETLPPADQPYAVPENWVWVKLKYLGNYINGRAFKPSDWSSHGLPIIRIQNLNNPDAEFNYCDFQVEEKFLIRDEDLLFAWSGTPGTSFGAHIWNGGNAVLNQHIFRIEFHEQLIERYFFKYALNHVVDDFIRKAHGSAGLAHITKKTFEESAIPLPPLPEQLRIVKKLNALLGKLREARALIDEARESFALRRAAILHQAFSGKLTAAWRAEHPETASRSGELFDAEIKEKPFDIPETWKWRSLDSVTKIEMGQSPAGSSYNEDGIGIPLINGPTEFGKEPFSKTLKTKWTTSPTKMCDENDLLLCVRGATLGRTNIAGFQACIGRGVASIKALFDQSFINYMIHYLRDDIYQQGTGTTFPNISKQDICKITIPFPPLEEQREIVRQLESLLGHETDAAALLDMDDELDLLEQSILSRAFRGELGTNDPAEPPAI